MSANLINGNAAWKGNSPFKLFRFLIAENLSEFFLNKSINRLTDLKDICGLYARINSQLQRLCIKKVVCNQIVKRNEKCIDGKLNTTFNYNFAMGPFLFFNFN